MKKPTDKRFDEKVRLDITTGCHVWEGATTDRGYGSFYVDGRRIGAHRFSFEREHGVIPYGLTIDHLCFNKRCVNPEHMEAVTNEENLARRRTKTHCKNGHEFNEENTYIRPDNGTRQCRACNKIRNKSATTATKP